MRIRRDFTVLLVLLLLILSVSCSAKKEIGEVAGMTRVATLFPEKRIYNEELASFGTVSYKTKNDVTALVEGTISVLSVKEGDTVKKGQVLAQLRNVQLELQKDQTENAIESARAVLNRIKPQKWDVQLGVESKMLSLESIEIKLAQKGRELANAKDTLRNKSELLAIGGITDAAFKDAELSVLSQESEIALMKNQLETAVLGLRDSDLLSNGFIPATKQDEKKKQFIELNSREINAEIESAEAGLRNAYNSQDSVNKLIEELTIRAPVNGIVGAKYYENGEFVKQNEKLFTLIDISAVNAVFSIQEQDIVFFSKGSKLSLEIQSLDRMIQARITDISSMADPESGNFTVKAEIRNDGGNIKPGMFVKCLIPKKSDEKILSLPESAIIKKSNDKYFVYSVVGTVAVYKEIVLRSIQNGMVWIESGITEKDMIIDSPSPFLKEGQNVTTK